MIWNRFSISVALRAIPAFTKRHFIWRGYVCRASRTPRDLKPSLNLAKIKQNQIVFYITIIIFVFDWIWNLYHNKRFWGFIKRHFWTNYILLSCGLLYQRWRTFFPLQGQTVLDTDKECLYMEQLSWNMIHRDLSWIGVKVTNCFQIHLVSCSIGIPFLSVYNQPKCYSIWIYFYLHI